MDVLYATLYGCQNELCATLRVDLFVVMNKNQISYTLVNIIFLSMRIGLMLLEII